MVRIHCVAAQLAASQEGLSSMVLVREYKDFLKIIYYVVRVPD
jgi:hypothetical protein